MKCCALALAAGSSPAMGRMLRSVRGVGGAASRGCGGPGRGPGPETGHDTQKPCAGPEPHATGPTRSATPPGYVLIRQPQWARRRGAAEQAVGLARAASKLFGISSRASSSSRRSWRRKPARWPGMRWPSDVRLTASTTSPTQADVPGLYDHNGARAQTRTSRRRSSPRIRTTPELRFSRARATISWTSSLLIGGRPRRLRPPVGFRCLM